MTIRSMSTKITRPRQINIFGVITVNLWSVSTRLQPNINTGSSINKSKNVVTLFVALIENA